MLIKSLTLRYWRNYGETTMRFASRGAYITGANGSGKTNLLEAIYYLANQLSFRTSRREELSGWDAEACLIGATVMQRDTQRQSDLAVRLWRGGRRTLTLNGKETRDLRRFTAEFAAVAFHPGTLNVVKGGPAGRRHLVDRGIVSLQPEFARLSYDITRALRQRNALMRLRARSASPTLGTWTERFISLAARLTCYRQQHITQLNKTLVELVEVLGEDLGTLSLDYQPAVLKPYSVQERQKMLTADDSEALIHQRFVSEAGRLAAAENAAAQTLFGPQRDAIAIHYRNKEARGFASQGEQRLAAFLLVAALAIEIYRQRGYRPVVILDDIVSELDARNRKVVFDFLHTHAFQVFMTDVEERPLSSNLGPLTLLRVQQTNGRAELRHPSKPRAETPNGFGG